jgi:hypothetical protein
MILLLPLLVTTVCRSRNTAAAHYRQAAPPAGGGDAAVAVAVGGGGPPAGLAQQVARAANVAWTTPEWADDGTGAMPIGNGDVTAMVWVDQRSGDLRLVLGKSDAFDENGMKAKTGVLRLSFDPPLWVPPTPPPPPPSPPPRCPRTGPFLSSFAKSDASKVSTIGDQKHMIAAVRKWKGTAELAAARCCNTSGCVTFSFDADWGLELFSTTEVNVGGKVPGGHWQSWISQHSPAPAPPAPLPAPSWGPAVCQNEARFCQMLDLATGVVTVTTPHAVVEVSVDLNAPVINGAHKQAAGMLRVHASGRQGTHIKLIATLEPYRKEQPAVFAGPLYQRTCFPRFEHGDWVGTSNPKAIEWHHFNHINTSFFNDTMRAQGIDPATHPQLADPYTGRVFGGQVTGTGLATVPDSHGLQLSTGEASSGLPELDIQVTLLTLPQSSPDRWREVLSQLQRAPPSHGHSPVDCDRTPSSTWSSRAHCTTSWTELTNRSFIELQERNFNGSTGSRSAAENITTHAAWDRYLSLIQGRSAFAAIKFNGQEFLSNQSGRGWDFRVWGEACHFG